MKADGRRGALRGIAMLFLVALIGTLAKIYLVSIAFVQGPSMEPTLLSGDWVVIQKWPRTTNAGDLIVFKTGAFPDTLVKRVVALPNSSVWIDESALYVNGKKVFEPYARWNRLLFDCRYSEKFVLGNGEYFLLGDNRCSSWDSRSFGPIAKEQILGRVLFHFKFGGQAGF